MRSTTQGSQGAQNSEASRSNAKKLSAIALVAIFFLSSILIYDSQSTDADGIPSGSIPVSNASDLARVGTGVTYGGYTWSADADYFQTSDIVVSSISAVSQTNNILVGNELLSDGVYDGDNKTIQININSPKVSNGGFAIFGTVDNYILKNIHVTGSINLNYTSQMNSTSSTVSALVCEVKSTLAPGSSVINCSFEGTSNVSFVATGSTVYYVPHVAGLIGKATGSAISAGTISISKCYFDGSLKLKISTGGGYTAGSISGLVYRVGGKTSNPASIDQCYAIGNLERVAETSSKSTLRMGYVAGISAELNYASISNCYSDMDMKSKSPSDEASIQALAGIAFQLYDFVGSNCYSVSRYDVSEVSGPYRLYGTVGNSLFGSVTNLAYCVHLDNDIFQDSKSIACTDVQMKDVETYARWDFTNVWKMIDGGYPILFAFHRPVLDIVSVPNESAISGHVWSYTPEITADGVLAPDAIISVAGASWLSVLGNVLSGTPDVVGSYDVVVSALVRGVTVTQEFTIIVVQDAIRITSTTSMISISSGTLWQYNVIVSESGTTLSITGVPWLSVTGNTISGTAPIPIDDTSVWNLTVTASKVGFVSATQNVQFTVSKPQESDAIPVPLILVTHMGGMTYRFDGSASSDTSDLRWDFGNGTLGTGVIVENTFSHSGAYKVILSASNEYGVATDEKRVLIIDSSPIKAAFFAQPYYYTVAIDTQSVTPVLTGASWLSISDYGDDYVTMHGVPLSTLFVGQTYNVVLSAGGETKEWPITVRGGTGWPIPGFSASVNGMTVSVVSSAINADYIFYSYSEGGSSYPSSGNSTYTYSNPGTYKITQTVRTTVNGVPVTNDFSLLVIIASPSVIPDEPTPPPDEGGETLFDKLTEPGVLVCMVLAVISAICTVLSKHRMRIIGVVATIFALLGFAWQGVF